MHAQTLFHCRFQEGVLSIPELEVMGSPEMSVVAVQARDPSKLNVYKLNDLMEKVGVCVLDMLCMLRKSFKLNVYKLNDLMEKVGVCVLYMLCMLRKSFKLNVYKLNDLMEKVGVCVLDMYVAQIL
jgi:hypothetical protein